MRGSTSEAPRGGVAHHGLRAVTEFLEGHGVHFETVEHAYTDTAAAESRAAHVYIGEMAKTVVVRDGAHGWILAIVPASRKVSLLKLRDLLGVPGYLRLATEREIADHFPDYAVGAIPPFGPVLVNATVVDEQVLAHHEVICAGGDHHHAIRMDPRDIVRLADAHTGDIRQDW